MRAVLLILCLTFAAGGPALGQAGRPQGLPGAVLKEVRHADRLPLGRYVSVARWNVVPGASHLTGRAIRDAGSVSGQAWEARHGASQPGKAMVYGPYLDVPAGQYVAFVRLWIPEDIAEEPVVHLDAAVGYGQKICAAQDVLGSDLAPGRYARVPIAFTCPGGKLEIRLSWSGYVAVRADTVELYRLEDGVIAPSPPRAPAAVPSGEPSDLDPVQEKRPYPDIFPRSSAPAKTLYVCDLTREPPDVQLCVLVLQGIINRKQPALYCLYNETDATWLNWMRRNKWVTDTRNVKRWTLLLSWFRSRIRGVVVTDPAQPASKNVANMIAALEDCLVVSPRLLKQTLQAAPAPELEVKADLRGRWRSSAEAYRWALDNLWPRLNHHLAACSYPEHLGLRDYLTQHRAFIFWISGPIDGARPFADPTAEARVAEDLLARMPANSPIMSYPWAAKDVGIGEGPGVTLFAEFGKYLVGSINCTNLSVHSGVVVPNLRPRPAPAPRLDANKAYVSFIMSDGDNLPVLTVSNFPQLWASPSRGKTPMGWTLSPAAGLLIPDVVSYYYTTATANDAFVAAVSGVGYTYPDSYGLRFKQDLRDTVFDGFLDQTGVYMRLLGLRSIWIMNAARPEKVRRYAERISGLEALFPDYGRRVSEYRDAAYPIGANVPVFHAVTAWTEEATREQRIEQMADEIRSMTPQERPAFLHAFIWNWGADLGIYEEVMKRLGPGYVAVRPDHLASLYRQDLNRRQLLVRMPDRTVGIEGRELELDVSLQNVHQAPMKLSARVSSGLHGARVSPSTMDLAAGESVELKLRGIPDADQIGLFIRGAAGERRYGVPIKRVPSAELDPGAVPPGTMRFMQRHEAERLAHNGGAAATDTAASSSAVWRADAGTAKPGYVVFGPYAPLPAGRYLALFRVKGGGIRNGDLATLDTCVGGGSKVTSSRNVAASELAGGEFRCIPLLFEHPGGEVETRLSWSGNGWVSLDWVTIWRVTADDG